MRLTNYHQVSINSAGEHWLFKICCMQIIKRSCTSANSWHICMICHISVMCQICQIMSYYILYMRYYILVLNLICLIFCICVICQIRIKYHICLIFYICIIKYVWFKCNSLNFCGTELHQCVALSVCCLCKSKKIEQLRVTSYRLHLLAPMDCWQICIPFDCVAAFRTTKIGNFRRWHKE